MLLQDDPHRRVERIGDTVRRPVSSPLVHDLLRYLAEVGFPYAPRLLGVDEQGREVLSYLDGESGPAGWARVVDPRGLVAMARLLRTYHEAVADYRPDGDGSSDGEGSGSGSGSGSGEIVCHGDFGPWNLVWDGTRPVGIVDWDQAVPARPVFDVAYALEYVAPFRDDVECRRWLAYPEVPDRRARLETFAEAYGLTSTDGLVDEVFRQQRQVRERVRQLAAAGVEPQAGWVANGHLDTLDARIAWSVAHRRLFEP
ncbi:aminoglycoside phosphotransferase family protein [Plantactinospora sonchi]|uniref:Aminoglycoside phosphotransferase family protein n=1 Tax=Plantactinospora sonchi TaxID=1544735 RepID=A0ABU7RLC8_9ACTN